MDNKTEAAHGDVNVVVKSKKKENEHVEHKQKNKKGYDNVLIEREILIFNFILKLKSGLFKI